MDKVGLRWLYRFLYFRFWLWGYVGFGIIGLTDWLCRGYCELLLSLLLLFVYSVWLFVCHNFTLGLTCLECWVYDCFDLFLVCCVCGFGCACCICVMVVYLMCLFELFCCGFIIVFIGVDLWLLLFVRCVFADVVSVRFCFIVCWLLVLCWGVAVVWFVLKLDLFNSIFSFSLYLFWYVWYYYSLDVVFTDDDWLDVV